MIPNPTFNTCFISEFMSTGRPEIQDHDWRRNRLFGLNKKRVNLWSISIYPNNALLNAHQRGRKGSRNESYGNHQIIALERLIRWNRGSLNPHNRYCKIIYICIQKSKLCELGPASSKQHYLKEIWRKSNNWRNGPLLSRSK